MEQIDLEKQYSIKIEKNDEYYLVYNYFGRLITQTKSLSEIKRIMEGRNGKN